MQKQKSRKHQNTHIKTSARVTHPVKVQTFVLPTLSLSLTDTKMERAETEAEDERRRRGTGAKNKGKEVVHPPPRRKLGLPPIALAPSNEVKLAAIAVDLNIRLRSADMHPLMQERAFRYTRALLDANPEMKPSPTRLAMCLKKVIIDVKIYLNLVVYEANF